MESRFSVAELTLTDSEQEPVLALARGSVPESERESVPEFSLLASALGSSDELQTKNQLLEREFLLMSE